MDDRVEGQASEHLGRRIAQSVGDERMGELVDRESDEQEDRDEDDLVGRDQFLEHGYLWRRVPRIVAGRPPVGPSRLPGSYSRLSSSAFLASYSAAVIAPRSRRSARLLRVR